MRRPKRCFTFYIGLAWGLSIGLALVIGALVAVVGLDHGRLVIPETALYTTATHAGENLAVATGQIDDGMEGLYLLDFVTGELQCVVLNQRVPTFNALFRTNILKDLGIDASKKRPKYLMVTGRSDFTSIRSSARPARSVVYVVDANTGRFAAYGLRWITTMARAGRPQQGQLMLLDVGNARTAVVRE